MANIAQSYLILHFSINCMLPLVILGFPRLIYSISELAIAISYSRFSLLKIGLFAG